MRSQLSFRSLMLLMGMIATSAFADGKPRLVGLFHDQAIVEVDGKQLVLKAGGPAKRGIKLISADSQEAVMEVNGEVSTYRVGTQIGSNFVTAPAAGKVVQIAPDRNGMYIVSGTINSYAVTFLVDTGATTIAMNKHTAKRMGLNYRLDGREGITQTASGFAKVYNLTLKKVTVGDITLTDVEASVLDGDLPSEVLLGNTFLGRVDMQRQGRVLLLRKN